MVPIKLEILNFLSYGEPIQTIDFSGHNLICLSGKNGHGKSAILDAITWSLWGQARKSSGSAKPDEGLLKLSKSKMFVALEFEVENQIFKIRREYTKTYSRPVSTLEFSVLNKEKNEFIPLTGKTIRETQQKIEDSIKISFETFSNSSFLRQGNSNEFSKKTPKERKEIICKILGLDKFEALFKKSSQKAREKELKIRTIQALQEKNHKIVESLNEKKESLKKKETQLKSFFLKISSLKKEILELENENLNLKKANQEIEQKKKSYLKLKNQVQDLEKEETLEAEKKSSAEQKIKSSASIDQLEKEKETLEKKVLEFEKGLKEKVFYQEEKISLEKNLFQAKENLKLSFEKLEKEFYQNKAKKDLELAKTNSEKESLFKSISELKTFLQKKEAQIKELEKYQPEKLLKEAKEKELFLEKGKENFYKLAEEKNKILSKIKELKSLEEKDFLKNCPTCLQDISLEKKNKIIENCKNEKTQLSKNFKEKEKAILDLKNKLIEKKKEFDLFCIELKNAQSQNDKNKLFKNDQKEALLKKKKLEEETLTLEKEIKKIQAESLDLKTFFEKEKKAFLEKLNSEQIKQAEKNILEKAKKINILKEKEEAGQKDKELLKKITEQIFSLKNIDVLKETVKFIKEKIEKIKVEKKLKNLEAGKLKNELEGQGLLEEKIKKLNLFLADKKRDLSFNEKEALKINQDVGGLKNEICNILKTKEEAASLEKEVSSLNQQIQDYLILCQAFGKNGIQALLIEEAIPEIEDESNQVLSLISQTQAKIFIESLKDLKKGGVKESLDIKISDSSGIRDYEMFSGGEAFRIDFALRIGISKVIARRAGTCLKTLIIDEGFGSLDEDGVNLLINCIYRIIGDFEKIIIVSHLPLLKESFPIHFFVEKIPTGSKVRVEKRG